jgi:CubicO group peptidase (beta-lactamase class C family)
MANLLNHTAGLHQLTAGTLLATPLAQRDQLVASFCPPSWWESGHDIGYSEVSAWHLLNDVIEALTGEPTAAFVRHRILGPMGLEDGLFVAGMSDAEYAANAPRLGVNVWFAGSDSADPMLMERSPRMRCDPNPAVGSSATARGLGRFYDMLLAVLCGSPGPISRARLDELISRQSHEVDRVTQRVCTYGYGFMLDLIGHDFGRSCGSRAFGHSGHGGMTAAFCDPDDGLVAAWHVNGRLDAVSSVGFRQPVLAELVYRSMVGTRVVNGS